MSERGQPDKGGDKDDEIDEINHGIFSYSQVRKKIDLTPADCHVECAGRGVKKTLVFYEALTAARLSGVAGTPATARTAVRARDSRTHAGAIRKFNASVVRFGSTS
jgi:hypothetical protein